MCVLRLLETLASDEATKEATRDVASFALAAAVPFALGEPTTDYRNVTGGTGTSDRLARELTTRAVAAVTALAAIDPRQRVDPQHEEVAEALQVNEFYAATSAKVLQNLEEVKEHPTEEDIQQETSVSAIMSHLYNNMT